MSASNDLSLNLTLRATDQGLVATVDNATDSAEGLENQLGKTTQSTKQFANETRKAKSSIGGGIVTATAWAAALGAAGVAAAGYAVALNVDAIRETDQFAQVLGMSTQAMTEWQYAAEVMGISGDQVGQMFLDIQDKIGDLAATGGGEAVDIFETMNVQLSELMSMSPDQQLLSIADAMDDINQNQKIFFLEGLSSDLGRLLPLFKDNAAELQRLQLEAQILGRSISDIDAAKVTQAGQAFGRVGGVIKGITNEATVALAPVLTGIADSLVDSAVEAGGFESAMIGAVDASVTGIGHVLDVGQQFLIWGKHAEIGLITVGQYGTAAMAGIADTTAALINLSLYPMQQTIAWIIDQLAGLVELGASLGGPFADSFSEASAWLKTFSGDVEQFHVQGADIIALNEQMQTSLATAATELETLLNTGAPSEDLKAWVQRLREESEQAAQAQVALRAETATTGEIVGAGVDVDPYAKLNKELKEQLALVGLTAREVAIETNLRKLNADATKEQKDEITRLTNELYDAQEKESLTDTLFDIDANDIEKQMKPLLDQIDYLKEQMAFDGMSDEMKKNIGDGIKQLKDDVDQVKFDHITNNAKDGLRSIQTMTDEGSKGYQALGIAVNAISAVQAVQAVVLQLSSGDPYTVFARAAAAAAAVASLGFSISGFGGSDSKPTMSSEQIGFETAKLDNESVVSRLDQQIELLEAIERNGSAAAINVDLAAAEYQGAIFEWVEDVFDSSRMGFVDAMFDESSAAWTAIKEHYENLEIANPYEMDGDRIRINAEQYYQDPTALIAVIKDIAQSSDGFNYSGPFGQSIADEYGYGEDAHEAFRAAMRSSFTELQGHLNDWAVTSIESLTDLSDASETMKESFDAITGTSRYATDEIDNAYDALEQIAGSNYAGYLEDNIDAISNAEGWLEQLSNSYGENGKQLSNFQLLLSKDAELFEEQAVAVEQFGAILGGTFQGGAEEALNLMSSIELVAESMKKTHELEDQILELTNAEEYLVTMRRRELEALTESQQVLLRQVWALEDWAEAQAAAAQIGDMIDDALSPLSSAEKTLDSANRAMTALGMSGLTYQDALASVQEYDTEDIVNLADALGMSFAEIQEMIQDIINGNEQITGGGAGVLSVGAAQSAVDAAEGVIWQRYGDIIDDTFGGQIPTLQEFNRVYGDQADQLKTIQFDNAAIISQLGGMPSSVADLRDTYFDQFGGLTLVEPVDELGIQIAEVYDTFLGRLPDQAGLDYWLDELKADASIDDVINSISNNAEAAEYGQYQDLREDMQAYFDDYDTDIIGMDTALAAWDAANESYNDALIASADSATGAVNSAAASFLQGIKNELGGFDLEGEDLELYELDLWYEGMVAQANELGVQLTELDELYGKKRVAITEQYAEEALEAAQKAAEQQVEDAGLNTYLQSVSDYVDDQTKHIKDSFADQIAVIEQWQDVAKDLRGYVEQIRLSELSPLGPQEKLQEAQESFAALLVAAEAGDLEAAGKLTGAADTYLGLADDYYGRSDAYTAEFNNVVDSLDRLGINWLAENGDDEITRINNEMKSELEDLSNYARQELEYARQQSVALTGIDTTLGEWPSKFDVMLGDLATDISGAVTAAIPKSPDRPVITGGAVGGGSAGQLTAGDDYGSVDVTAPVSAGMSDADARAIIIASGNGGVDTASYKEAISTLGITNHGQIADILDGSHADGLNRVPFDNYRANLHKDEMILTADVAEHVRQSMRVSGHSQTVTDPVLIRLIESLVASNQRLEDEVAALRSERSSADETANEKREKLIRETKKSGRSAVETV